MGLAGVQGKKLRIKRKEKSKTNKTTKPRASLTKNNEKNKVSRLLLCGSLHARKRERVDLDQRLVVVGGAGCKDFRVNVMVSEAPVTPLEAQLTSNLLRALTDNALQQSELVLAGCRLLLLFANLLDFNHRALS